MPKRRAAFHGWLHSGGRARLSVGRRGTEHTVRRFPRYMTCYTHPGSVLLFADGIACACHVVGALVAARSETRTEGSKHAWAA
jgi:hypothetical protein